MVSEAFSSEIDFCLNMTLPFLSSAIGLLCAAAIDSDVRDTRPGGQGNSLEDVDAPEVARTRS